MNTEWMVGFGYKQAWLAVREGDPDLVTKALGLRDLGTAPWRSGVDLAYLTDDRLLLTPLLPGAGDTPWTLVAGEWLMRVRLDLVTLSEELATEVQAFATHRGMELHRWERAVRGDLVRAFEYLGESGEILRWVGEPDSAELALGLPAAPDGDVDVLVGEADVMRLAAAWSVDPSGLGGRPAPGPLRVVAVERGPYRMAHG